MTNSMYTNSKIQIITHCLHVLFLHHCLWPLLSFSISFFPLMSFTLEFFLIRIEDQSLLRVVFIYFLMYCFMYFITNMAHMQASWTRIQSNKVQLLHFLLWNEIQTDPNNPLPLPASPQCYPDRSAALSPLPCQTALFGAGEWPVALFLKSSWLGYIAPESVSDSTWCPLRTPLSWPAGGRTGCWGAEAG